MPVSMLELFTYDSSAFLLAAAMVGGLCSVIGVFVVLRGSHSRAGTAHAHLRSSAPVF